MTTETIVPQESVDLNDLEALDRMAFNIAVHVRRRCHLPYPTWRLHLEDLKQEGLVCLVEHAARPLGYAIKAAVNTMIEYVLVTIRNLQGGWYFSAGDIDGYRTGYIEELGPPRDRFDAGDPYEWLLPDEDLRSGVPRPVERQLLSREGRAAEVAFWEQAEQELLDVLIGMKEGQWHPEALVTAARILACSARGMSHHAIGAELEMDGTRVRRIRDHYRQALETYLAKGALTQGLIAARGGSSYYRFEELTEEILNSGRKLLVAFPHGIFPLSVYSSRHKPHDYLRFQAGRRIGGRVYNRSVQVGQVGQVTREAVWDSSFLFQRKLKELEVRQGMYGH